MDSCGISVFPPHGIVDSVGFCGFCVHSVDSWGLFSVRPELWVRFGGLFLGSVFWGPVLGSRFGVPFWGPVLASRILGFQCVPNELFIKVQVWGPGVPFWGFRSGGPVLGVPFWGPYSGVRILGSVFWGPYSGVCILGSVFWGLYVSRGFVGFLCIPCFPVYSVDSVDF